MSRRIAPTRHCITIAAATLGIAALCDAQVDQVPQELQGIDIEEHLNENLPLDLEFLSEDGEVVRLGDHFTGDKPVMLVPNYYRCPQLCGLTLNGLVDGLKRIEWSIGNEFVVVTYSFNPKESWQLARAKNDGFTIDYADRSNEEGFTRTPDAADAGWRFLADHDDSARKLSEAIGFNYRYVPERDEYSHAACVVLCTPDGRISRYLYGSYFRPADLKLALVEAGEGKVGSAFDRFLLWCHRYDPDKGYVKSALQIMKLGGALTLLTMAVGLFLLWRTDRLHARQAQSDGGTPQILFDGSHS